MASKKSKKKKTPAVDPNSRTICRNRRARHDYEIVEELECGIVLTGSEVKSIRDNKVTIDEGFARIQNGELWLINCDIAEYPQATYLNHERRRERKLLLKRREFRKFAESAGHDGMTLIPLSMYFTRGLVKVTIGAARGRKKYDQRDKLKSNQARRTMQEAMRKKY
ncbi:SsrA-binding protein [Thalassoglobus neptunius]|uniref:SsrA-binding protein n=1 Tax=Thalassoglobus neptunius TaxID=1938619 RepID=A0A5C5WZ94_9PLAN|nr:SsrA-binding protein SmpB [Thalassoglobus neptunius]TWT55242.1 SsrA-binding protein [Thalassoglobus neptunius]